MIIIQNNTNTSMAEIGCIYENRCKERLSVRLKPKIMAASCTSSKTVQHWVRICTKHMLYKEFNCFLWLRNGHKFMSYSMWLKKETLLDSCNQNSHDKWLWIRTLRPDSKHRLLNLWQKFYSKLISSFQSYWIMTQKHLHLHSHSSNMINWLRTCLTDIMPSWQHFCELIFFH